MPYQKEASARERAVTVRPHRSVWPDNRHFARSQVSDRNAAQPAGRDEHVGGFESGQRRICEAE